jgi:hypothetical protein
MGETPEDMLNRLSGVLGVDTVFYIEGTKIYLGVHTSAKRIESQMEAVVAFTTQFPDLTVYVMGDFNVLLSQSGPTTLQVHPKTLSENALDASNVEAVIDFHRPVSFVKPPVDTTCKRRWETTQGEKVGVSFSVKIDYIFRVEVAGTTVSDTLNAHVFEHDQELTTSRPPAPWFPADHFTLEVQFGSDIFRSWNICGESLTAEASPSISRPVSARTASQKDTDKLSIAPNCFEFLTAGANAFYNEHPEIMEHFHRVLEGMPDFEGVPFRDRYLGSSSIGEGETTEEESRRLKAGGISTLLRNCPSVNIHYKSYLCENDSSEAAPSASAPTVVVAMEVAVSEDGGTIAEAVAVEGSLTPMEGDIASPSGKIIDPSGATATAVTITEVMVPKSPRIEEQRQATTSEKGKIQMRLLKKLFEAAEEQYRGSATPIQLALYEQYVEFRRRLEEVPIIRTFLAQFYAEVIEFDRQDFLHILLPVLKTRSVKVWALQEVSAPLQQKLDRLSRVLRQEYGYEVVRREIPADQKTWGVLLVRQELL